MAANKWLANWMEELSNEIGKLQVEDYQLRAQAGSGPVVFVTIEGASEDSTTARKVRLQVTKLMEASIKKQTDNTPGYEARVRSYNKGADLLLECIVVFP
jgi:hypothetical protein